jgi:hypothetical protein
LISSTAPLSCLSTSARDALMADDPEFKDRTTCLAASIARSAMDAFDGFAE